MAATNRIITKSLKSQLIDLIRLRGPLSVAEYMRLVLTNPTSGFYMNNDVFGVKGHFTTNPEVSQIFGEIVGAWILQEWRRFGCPKPLRLVEFGPGRGTLMSDITRTIGSIEKTSKLVQLQLIEMSPKLRAIQEQTLDRGTKSLIDKIQWHTHLDSIEKDETSIGFTAYIAHEYFDALPIHKFVRDKRTNRWRELVIDYDQNDELRFCINNQPTLAAKLLVPQDFQGDHIEVCPEAALQLEKVVERLNASQTGCMLICDYGFEEEPEINPVNEPNIPTLAHKSILSNRDTFRAFKEHEPWPPLRSPGDADLTADVDFGYLKRNIKDKANIFGCVEQRKFLSGCGIDSRLRNLMDKANASEKADLLSGTDLMMNDMGQRYKFMAIFPKESERLFDGDPPAGFSG